MQTKTADAARHRVDIAHALKAVRENAGHTQAELAAITGVKQQLISRYEADLGGIEPAASTLYVLEEAMGVPHGSVLRAAQMIDDGNGTVLQALELDPSLTPGMREVVAGTYAIAVRRSVTDTGRVATKPARVARSK